jgi:hypothetical protein
VVEHCLRCHLEHADAPERSPILTLLIYNIILILARVSMIFINSVLNNFVKTHANKNMANACRCRRSFISLHGKKSYAELGQALICYTQAAHKTGHQQLNAEEL